MIIRIFEGMIWLPLIRAFSKVVYYCVRGHPQILDIAEGGGEGFTRFAGLDGLYGWPLKYFAHSSYFPGILRRRRKNGSFVKICLYNRNRDHIFQGTNLEFSSTQPAHPHDCLMGS